MMNFKHGCSSTMLAAVLVALVALASELQGAAGMQLALSTDDAACSEDCRAEFARVVGCLANAGAARGRRLQRRTFDDDMPDGWGRSSANKRAMRSLSSSPMARTAPKKPCMSQSDQSDTCVQQPPAVEQKIKRVSPQKIQGVSPQMQSLRGLFPTLTSTAATAQLLGRSPTAVSSLSRGGAAWPPWSDQQLRSSSWARPHLGSSPHTAARGLGTAAGTSAPQVRVQGFDVPTAGESDHNPNPEPNGIALPGAAPQEWRAEGDSDDGKHELLHPPSRADASAGEDAAPSHAYTLELAHAVPGVLADETDPLGNADENDREERADETRVDDDDDEDAKTMSSLGERSRPASPPSHPVVHEDDSQVSRINQRRHPSFVDVPLWPPGAPPASADAVGAHDYHMVSTEEAAGAAPQRWSSDRHHFRQRAAAASARAASAGRKWLKDLARFERRLSASSGSSARQRKGESKSLTDSLHSDARTRDDPGSMDDDATGATSWPDRTPHSAPLGSSAPPGNTAPPEGFVYGRYPPTSSTFSDDLTEKGRRRLVRRSNTRDSQVLVLEPTAQEVSQCVCSSRLVADAQALRGCAGCAGAADSDVLAERIDGLLAWCRSASMLASPPALPRTRLVVALGSATGQPSIGPSDGDLETVVGNATRSDSKPLPTATPSSASGLILGRLLVVASVLFSLSQVW